MASDPVIGSARIALRPVSEDDVVAITDGCGDPEVARFIPVIPQPCTVDHVRSFVEAARSDWSAGEAAELVVEDADTEEFLGMVSVSLPNDGSAGYWIKPGARGGGIATEALVLAVQWARETHAVTRLYLTTHPENFASQRVAEKAGFQRAGVIEQAPPFADGETTAVRFERRE